MNSGSGGRIPESWAHIPRLRVARTVTGTHTKRRFRPDTVRFVGGLRIGRLSVLPEDRDLSEDEFEQLRTSSSITGNGVPGPVGAGWRCRNRGNQRPEIPKDVRKGRESEHGYLNRRSGNDSPKPFPSGTIGAWLEATSPGLCALLKSPP